jgi:2-keto-3-deoxy-L-rhamnonate aldolase RhmA
MGHPGEYDHPTVVKPMESILKCCLQHRIPFGTTASGPKAAARWVKKGCRFFEVVDELSLISAGAAQTVQAYRKFSP